MGQGKQDEIKVIYSVLKS